MDMGTRELSLVPARAALGATMMYHGLGKLRGEGAQQAAGMFEQLGFKPGATWAKLTGGAEVFAGASAILGIGTRLGALAVLVTQSVAIAKVHASKGFDIMAGGYEYNLALIAMALGLLATGPGAISLHELVEHRLEGREGWNPLRRLRDTAAVRVAKLLK